MSSQIELIITVVCAVIASSGFWTFITHRQEKKNHRTKMLLGLAHDRIMYLTGKYLERDDWITQDEFENLVDYLYVPYAKCGGNGAAERSISEVKHKLKIVRVPPLEYMKQITYKKSGGSNNESE